MQIGHFHNASSFVKSQDLRCQGHWRAGVERQMLEVASEAGKWLLFPPKLSEQFSEVGKDTELVSLLPMLSIPSTMVYSKDVSG